MMIRMDTGTVHHCLALLMEAQELLEADGEDLQAARLSLVIENFRHVYRAADTALIPPRRAVH